MKEHVSWKEKIKKEFLRNSCNLCHHERLHSMLECESFSLLFSGLGRSFHSFDFLMLVFRSIKFRMWCSVISRARLRSTQRFDRSWSLVCFKFHSVHSWMIALHLNVESEPNQRRSVRKVWSISKVVVHKYFSFKLKNLNSNSFQTYFLFI